MGQARRTRSAAAAARGSVSGWTGFLAGLIVGVAGTVFYLRGDSLALGSGLKQLFVASDSDTSSAAPAAITEPPLPASPRFDFYTVLPEIERILPSLPPDSSPPPAATPAPGPAESGVTYVLQAGSYARFADADRLKAQLVLAGLAVQIQKVSIDGKGVFYRVRVGPFTTVRDMDAASERLVREGIQALRLKVSAAED